MEEAGSTSHRHSLKKHPHSPNLNNLYQRSPEELPPSGTQQEPLQPHPSSRTRDFAHTMLSRHSHSSSSRHSHDDPEKEPKPKLHLFGGSGEDDDDDIQSPIPFSPSQPPTNNSSAQAAQAAQAAMDARRVSFGHRDPSNASMQQRDSHFPPNTSPIPSHAPEHDSRTNGDIQRNPSNRVTDEALSTHETPKGKLTHDVAELPEPQTIKRPPHSSLTWQAAAASNTVSLDPEIASRVALFRALVGITSTDADRNAHKRPTAAGLLGRLRRRTLNKGVYKRILDQEFRATYQHFIAWHVINFALIVQIFLGAAVASIGSFEGHNIRVAVVVLGALNTAFASTLAYMKGQGLPKRLLEYRNALRRAREYCEFREREFELGLDKDLDPQKEAQHVYKMYEAARQDEEENNPDMYINRQEQERVKEAGGKGNMPPGTTPPHKNSKKGKI